MIKNIIKKYLVLIILIILCGVLIFLKIFFGGKSDNTSIEVPTPTISPTINQELNFDTGDDTGFEEYMPYEGKKMKITGYLTDNEIEVLIRKGGDKKEAEEEVEGWIKKFGEDLRKNKFVYKIADF